MGKSRRLLGMRSGRRRLSARCGTAARDLAPIVADIRKYGASSLRQIAAALTARSLPTPKGGAWTAAATTLRLGLIVVVACAIAGTIALLAL